MLYSTAASLFLAGCAAAAPTLIPAPLQARSSSKVDYEYLNVTYSSASASGYNSSLPNVLILATGGTPQCARSLILRDC